MSQEQERENPEPLSLVAHKLARQHKRQNWLAIGFVLMLFVYVGREMYWTWDAREPHEIVVWDTNVGTVMLAPMVDPVDSKEILRIASTWTAETILNRSEAGLDHAWLVPILFDQDTAKKVDKEFSDRKEEYKAKHLISTIEIKKISGQQMYDSKVGHFIRSTTTLEYVLNWYDANDQPLREFKDVTLKMDFVVNPHMEHVKRFPLMCVRYIEDPPPTNVAVK